MLLRELAGQARIRGADRTPGYQERSVLWEVVLSPDGSHGSLRRLDGPRGETMRVPDIQRSGTTPKPFPCADKAGLVFGVPKNAAAGSDGSSEAAKAIVAAAAFAQATASCAADTGDPAVTALDSWLIRARPGVTTEALAAVNEPDRVCFRIDGQSVRLHELASVASWWAVRAESVKSIASGWCLVCGQTRPLAATFPQPLRSGSLGADAATLISVNEPAFGRQSQEQLGASPICLGCAQASVAGLQSLLDTQHNKEGHRQAVKLADDRRLVFWLPGSAEQPALLDWLNEPDPAQVDRLLSSPRTASAGDADLRGQQFVSVTLGLNKSRVVIRDYQQQSLPELEAHVRAWFADSQTAPAFPTDMKSASGRSGYHSIPMIERSLTNRARAAGDAGLGEALWRTALFARPLAPQLLARAVDRERSESVAVHSRDPQDRLDVRRRSAARIALLTLLHTRTRRPEDPAVLTTANHVTGAVEPAGSTELTTPEPPAMLLGRLFGCLEAIQTAALGRELNAPLSARWLGRASTSPVAAYPALLRNAPNHLNKLRKDRPGTAYNLQRQLDALAAELAGFPATLTLAEQGTWFLGLHRYRADEDAARATARAPGKASAPEITDGLETTADA